MCVIIHTPRLALPKEQVKLGIPGGMGEDSSPCRWGPRLHLVEPTLSWLAGSSLVPSWASVASDHPSEPPVQGCVVGKRARWLGAVACLSCSACGCGCLPPLIIIIKYNLAEGGWGELSDPPPRLPGSTGRGPRVVSRSTLFCHPLSQSRGHLPRRIPGDHPGVHSHPHKRHTILLGVDFWPHYSCRWT